MPRIATKRGVAPRRRPSLPVTVAVFVAVLALALAGCADDASDTTLVRLDGVPIDVVVADTSAEHLRGLQGAESLEDGEGMLFVWEEPAVRTFAMKDVSFPIDVIFFDESQNVTAIEPLDPGDEHRVTSPSPTRYVLETPQGWAERIGITVGEPLVIVD
jgi:uncharacterized membrane protein (UPF0127 family)